MFTGNAWNCYFRLNIYIYICRHFGETRSTNMRDRRAILPASHYVTYNLTHAPRKGLHVCKTRNYDPHTGTGSYGLSRMSLRMTCSEFSPCWAELCKKARAVSRRLVFPHNFNHVNKFGMWLYIIRPHLPAILSAHSKQVRSFAINLTFYRLRLSLLLKENQTCFGHMGYSRH